MRDNLPFRHARLVLGWFETWFGGGWDWVMVSFVYRGMEYRKTPL